MFSPHRIRLLVSSNPGEFQAWYDPCIFKVIAPNKRPAAKLRCLTRPSASRFDLQPIIAMDQASRDMLKRIYARKHQAPALDPEMLYAAETLVRFKRPNFWLKHPIRDSRPAYWHRPTSSQAAPASPAPSSIRSYCRTRVRSSKPRYGMYLGHLHAVRSRCNCGEPAGVDALPWHLAQMRAGVRKDGSVGMEHRDEARRLDPEEYTRSV